MARGHKSKEGYEGTCASANFTASDPAWNYTQLREKKETQIKIVTVYFSARFNELLPALASAVGGIFFCATALALDDILSKLLVRYMAELGDFRQLVLKDQKYSVAFSSHRICIGGGVIEIWDLDKMAPPMEIPRVICSRPFQR